MKELFVTLVVVSIFASLNGCQFYPPGEYLRFVRVPENLQIGDEVLKIEVHPRRNLKLQAVDKVRDVNDDVHYFNYKDVNKTMISLVLARSLDDLVDTESPQNVLKFKLVCDYEDGEDTISSSLSITVYVEDVNDHSPVFFGTPYNVVVDELTPVGLNIFRRIRATDRDKPNTPNSDVQYAITAGNERGKFTLDSSHQAFLLLSKPLDYDAGDREFTITVTASDRGVPPKSANATVKITVKDADDLSPKFTKGVYRSKMTEFYPLTGEKIHHRITFDPPIYAFDQDTAIDTPIRYDILAGNDRHLFYLDHVNGSLFLEREVDLDAERALPGNTFVLQIQASQVDNVLKAGVARVEIEVTDLNDNLPEFEVDFYNISIVENLPNGFSVLQIIATDQDQGDNAEFTYELEDISKAFEIDSRNGWLMVKDHAVLDREKRSSITMRVFAKEKAPSVVTNKIGISSVPVEITVLDSNDNNPTFIPGNVYEFKTNVNGKIGDVIGQVHAIDPDLGRNGLVSYSIQKSTSNSTMFKIDPRTGQIFINDVLIQARYTTLVEATDQPVNPSERRFSLAVVIIDVNSSTKESPKQFPEFIGAPYEFWVGGNVDVGTSVGQVRITEISGDNHFMYDLLHSYKEGVPFAIEEKSGTITVVDQLPKFLRNSYDFEAVVTNDKDMSIVTNVTVHVVNPDDEKIILMKNSESKPIEFHVKENQAGVLVGKLIYPNTTSMSVLKYSIANQRDVTDFIGISADGSLYTQKALDRETRDSYRLTIIVENLNGFVVTTGIYQVTIYVDDENDNAPSFEHALYTGKIPENSKTGTEIELNYPIKANDLDVGENGQVTLTLRGEGNETFRLERFTGKIYLQSRFNRLDREQKPVYNLHLVAKDKGGLSGEAKLTIKVEDENDNAPKFTQILIMANEGVEVLEYQESKSAIKIFQEHRINATGVFTLTQSQIKSLGRNKNPAMPLISVAEDIAIGTTIFKVIAEDLDLDINAVIKYQMASETYIPKIVNLVDPYNAVQYFMVHPSSGEVASARTLPPESEFRLNITASDKDGLKDNVTIKIYIKDVNNHNPTFIKSWYNFDTEESLYSKKVLGKIEATDDDFGQNANISYRIENISRDSLPFTIGKFNGILSTNGELDREKKDNYSFVVIASDNPEENKGLSSSVVVEVNIMDVNDNAPTFYGYDDIVSLNVQDFGKHKSHTFAESIDVPIYYASIKENSPIDAVVARVFANDSDFAGNGNGLILFSIPQRKNKENLFAIDSKEGIITIIGKIDFEKQRIYNITVIASDLGSPSLNSIAVVSVGVIDIPEDLKNPDQAIFTHRYYEVEVQENVPVPLKVLTLNVTEPYRRYKLRYSIIADKNSDESRMFKIDPRNGTIFLIKSPDREGKFLYELKIRVDEYKVGRDMTVMVYPISNEKIADLNLNEVKVIVRITDLNDNIPKFTIVGRPIIAAIPTSASYGYQIIRLQAKDADSGLNSEIRYQILGRVDDESRRFAIDSVTGQVRAIASFSKEAGRVYGFDVKATDRRGADDGKSAIANVFVYVLDEQKQIVMVVGTKATEVEKNLENITSILYNATGYDIRIRKLEPHSDRNHRDTSATDMYIYAVDPALNMVVSVEKLQKLLNVKQNEIEKGLEPYKFLALTSGSSDREQSKNQRVLLSTLEIGVVILGTIVFIGALTTAICVVCIRQKKKSLVRKNFTHAQTLGYTLASNGKPILFPSTYAEGFQYSEPGQLDLIPQPSGYPIQLDSSRFVDQKQTIRKRAKSAGGLETSITSLHSSGQDSGIVDSSLHCPCGQSTSPSLAESNNSSYEDSLNSEAQRKTQETSFSQKSLSSSKNLQQRRSRNRSLSDGAGLLQRSAAVSAFPPRSHINPPYLIPGHTPVRRPNDRLFLSRNINP